MTTTQKGLCTRCGTPTGSRRRELCSACYVVAMRTAGRRRWEDGRRPNRVETAQEIEDRIDANEAKAWHFDAGWTNRAYRPE